MIHVTAQDICSGSEEEDDEPVKEGTTTSSSNVVMGTETSNLVSGSGEAKEKAVDNSDMEITCVSQGTTEHDNGAGEHSEIYQLLSLIS